LSVVAEKVIIKMMMSVQAEKPSDMQASEGGPVLVALSREECLRLLRSKRVGRLAVDVDRRPQIFPVNYAVADDGSVVVRTEAGTKLSYASQWWVAFEVDEVDREGRSGWSVVVRGIAFDISRSLDHRSESLRHLRVDSWAPGPPSRRLAISPEVVMGRRLVSSGPGISPHRGGT